MTSIIHEPTEDLLQHFAPTLGRSRLLEFWSATVGAYIAGGLTDAAIRQGIDLSPTPVLMDIGRAATLGLLIIAVFAWLIHRETDAAVRRVSAEQVRNRNAIESVVHAVERDRTVTDELRRAILGASGRVGEAMAAYAGELGQLRADHSETVTELARMRGRLDATLMEQNELLQRLGQRLAVDVGVAYDLGAQSRD